MCLSIHVSFFLSIYTFNSIQHLHTFLWSSRCKFLQVFIFCVAHLHTFLTVESVFVQCEWAPVVDGLIRSSSGVSICNFVLVKQQNEYRQFRDEWHGHLLEIPGCCCVLGEHAWRCDWRLYTQQTQSESESEKERRERGGEGADRQTGRQIQKERAGWQKFNRNLESLDKTLQKIHIPDLERDNSV